MKLRIKLVGLAAYAILTVAAYAVGLGDQVQASGVDAMAHASGECFWGNLLG